MKRWRSTAALTLAAVLAACGGGGGGSIGSSSGAAPAPATPTPTATPTPAATAAGCTLRERQDWAAAQLREWYLFPETLPASLDPTPYASVDDYVDALTATARGQRRDRYFTYLTSIKAENAYYDTGATASLGARLALDGSNRLVVTEAFENGPALAAGVDRGAVLEAVGPSAATLRDVSQIIAAGGVDALVDALGPETAGTTRAFRVNQAGRVSTVTLTKADFDLTPVSGRYGAKVIDTGSGRVGYLNLRTFINTADPALRAAFDQFRGQGVTDIVVDLRYNGGGLVSISELLSNLLGGARQATDVQSYTVFRPEKSQENETTYYAPLPQSVAATRIAFIGTGGTASASELTVNAAIPYLHANAALIGSNTYGKPVGQVALDLEACDDRLRVIAFATQNANRQGGYFDGLAGVVEASCQAADDLSHQLGDPAEASTAAAIAFLQGRDCTRIASAEATARSARTATARQDLITPARATTAQREVPGLF